MSLFSDSVGSSTHSSFGGYSTQPEALLVWLGTGHLALAACCCFCIDIVMILMDRDVMYIDIVMTLTYREVEAIKRATSITRLQRQGKQINKGKNLKHKNPRC